MDEFRYFNPRADQAKVVSRVDLWASSAVLAFFAVALGSTLLTTASAGEFLLRGLLTLVFVAGAGLFFQGALLWGKPRPTAKLEPQEPRELRGSIDKARTPRGKRAA